MLPWSLEHPYLMFILVIFGMATITNVAKTFASRETKKIKEDEEKHRTNGDFPEGEELARLYEELAKKPPGGNVH